MNHEFLTGQPLEAAQQIAANHDRLKEEYSDTNDVTSLEPLGGPSRKMRAAAKKAQAVHAFAEKSFAHETFFKLDAYAQEVEPPSFLGGIVSAVVILVTLGYCAFLIYQFITRPLLITNRIEWFQDMGPFPMNITCQATSGCFVSNYVKNDWTKAKVDPEQLKCKFIAYEDTYPVQQSYTMWPKDGLLVVYNANDTSEEMPPGYGYTAMSQANCMPEMCTEGITPLYAPVAPGASLASYVQTKNNTRSDAGKLRHEWFIVQVDSNSDVDSDGPCAADALAAHPAEQLIQSRIDLQPSFNIITVSRDDSWLGLWGTFGGAYELFLEFGGIFLASAGMLSLLERVWNYISGRPQRSQPDNEDNST